jgi:hypothetical protein
MTPEQEAELARIETVADWLDSRFRVPGTGIRFGLDGLVGLVPGVGDTLTAAAAVWILATARNLGAPPGLLARMGANVAVDWAIGLIPLVGDFFDVGFKASRRNAALLRRHFDSTDARRPSGR